MPHATWTTLAETSQDLSTPGQSRALERTVHDQGGRRVRVYVNVDSSYPDQSRLRTDLWDGTQWNEVTRLFGSDPTVLADKVSMRSPDIDAKRAYLDRLVDELLSRTAAILG